MEAPLTLYQARLLYEDSEEKGAAGEEGILFMRISVAIWAFTIFVDSRRFENLNTPEWVTSILIIMLVMAIVQSACAALSFALSLAQKLQVRRQPLADGSVPYCAWGILIVSKGLLFSAVYMGIEVTLIALMIFAFKKHFQEGGFNPDWGED